MQHIGTYILEGLIGQGGNGVVYRSTHPVLGRPVAVKALHEQIAHDPELRVRFLHEARVTLDLNHPGIVNVYDVDQDGARLFIVMEWFAHGSLAHALSRQRLPQPQALDVAAQIADALAFAHGQGVVHGDIKPSNILLRADGTPVVADFGLAADRRVPSQGDIIGGQVQGTPAYMAPEQIRGRATDARSDLYAFGVMLYELVSGTAPFNGTLEALLQHQLTEIPPPLREREPSVPDALDALVARLLAKDPAQRPSGMAEVAEEVRTMGSTLPAGETKLHVPAWVPPPLAVLPGAASAPPSGPLAPPSGPVTAPVEQAGGTPSAGEAEEPPAPPS